MEKEISLLVLDDESYIQRLIEREFRYETYGFLSTTDPEEAKKFLSEHPIKVFLCDQKMPKITGIEFLQEVMGKYPGVVRVLFTGYTDFQLAEDAVNIGQIYRFVNKPWEQGSLKAAVAQAIHYFDLIAENKKLFDSVQRENKELESLNKKLEGLVELQKEFTSIVSHELRTPLAAMKSTLDLVLQGIPGTLNVDQRKFLSKSQDNVDRLNRLVDDILDLSKIDSDHVTLEKNLCDLRGIISDVVDLQFNVAKAKRINLTADFSENLPSVMIDSDKIHRVLNNLINNAIKFTEQGDIKVLCTFQEAKKDIQVCVQDTGSGIQEEDIKKLFQKYQQVGDVQKQAGGTGLGLAICQEIIQLHGGEITVQSEYGKGSRFCFTLPVEDQRSVKHECK